MGEVEKNIARAQALKEEGNAAFKGGDYKKAMAAYHQIFLYVHGYSLSSGGSSGASGIPGQTTTPVSAEEMKVIKELKLVHFNNLAMCYLKLEPPNIQKAKTACTKALEIEPLNVKALFRRGKCYAQLNALDEAKDDLSRVIELQPDNVEAKRELQKLKGAFASLRKKEQKKFAGLFDRMQADQEMERKESAEAPAGDAGAASGSAGATTANSGAATVTGGGHPEAAGSSSSSGVGLGGASGGAAPMDGDDDDDDDIGEPLGAPQSFEPSEVSYVDPSRAAIDVT